jgi:hypothetical protein
MKGIIEMVGEPRQKAEAPTGIGRRLGWFVLLWLGGVASVGAVSLLLRTWIGS